MADDKLNVNPGLSQDGDDTVTRKTIKLRPALMPGAPVVVKPAAPRPAANTDTGNIDLPDDTKTRRTIKLKPVAVAAAPASPAAPAAPAAPAPAAAAPAADGDDTVTRKTIKLRPTLTPGAPAAAPEAPAAADESGEKTIRIQRPVKPVTGPAVVSRPVPAAPAVGAKPTPPPVQSVKLPTFQKPAAAAPVAAATTPAWEEEDDDASGTPSKVFLVLSIIALICMIYSTLLITVQFLDITQQQNTAEAVSFLVPGSKK